MWIHTFIVHLCGCVWVASTLCTHDLSLAAHIVIAECFPPDNGLSLTHKPHCFHDTCNMHLCIQLLTCCAVPAFHQVDQIQHEHECHWDIHIPLVTWWHLYLAGDWVSWEIDDYLHRIGKCLKCLIMFKNVQAWHSPQHFLFFALYCPI